MPYVNRYVDTCRDVAVRWLVWGGGIAPGDAGLAAVEGMVRRLEQTALRPCGSAGDKGPQFAIALMQKMKVGMTTEVFAKRLHDDWGVGHGEVSRVIPVLTTVSLLPCLLASSFAAAPPR